MRDDPGIRVRDEYGNAFARERLGPDLFGSRSRLHAAADVGGSKQRQQRVKIVGIGHSRIRHRGIFLD
jgi:hypothetical protein